jgi:hypothetical protein
MIYAGCEEWTRARDSLLFMLLVANGNNSNRLHYIRLLVMIDRKSSDIVTKYLDCVLYLDGNGFHSVFKSARSSFLCL